MSLTSGQLSFSIHNNAQGSPVLSSIIDLRTLESHLWEAANILRGSPIDRSDWKSYILPLLFFKRICDVWDEEYAEALETYGEDYTDEHRFQIPQGCYWQDARETPANVGAALQNAMHGSVFYSLFANAGRVAWRQDPLPLPMIEFGDFLEDEVKDLLLGWQENPGKKPREASEIEAFVSEGLGGTVKIETTGSKAGRWQWQAPNVKKAFEIEMSSTGQMETWPLVVAAQAIFGMPVEKRPKYLHIEEPEAHLHPKAQEAVIKILAYLMNHGVHIFITTHSLTIIYAINNLALAYQQIKDRQDQRFADLPPSVRINPDKLNAFLIHTHEYEKDAGTVEEIMYTSGAVMNDGQNLLQIDEGRLGEVLGDLQSRFNRLMNLSTAGANDGGPHAVHNG